MIRKVKLAIKFALFLITVCTCVGIVNEWLKPEYYYNDLWPTTNTYMDFYELEKNSVDVLFFGSSQAVSSFNPQVIYDTYGITSYNLGCEQQSLVITYYWLKEALKYQTPRVVVLETYTLHKYTDAYVYNDMNCSESAVRKAMDSMRLSMLKWEAGKVIEEIDPTQIALSFPLLNIRYHTRWTSIGEQDYTTYSMIEHGGVKGFSTLGGAVPGFIHEPFSAADAETVEPEEMVPTAKEYLDKIVALCDEKDIELILVKIPCAEPIERYKSTKAYADKLGLKFYDFNEETLYNEIEYNAAENLFSHLNYLGAEKISLYLGNLLKSDYAIPPRKDSSYDKSRLLYEHKIENIKLTETTDIYQYLDMLNNNNYSIFIFAPVGFSAYMDNEITNKLGQLGFTTDLRGVTDGTHYCAVRDSGGTVEKLSTENIKFSGSIRDGLTTYDFNIDTSVMIPNYQTFSMVINGTQCGNQKDGLNIVVYDNDLKIIVDKVNFNTNAEGIPASRY